MKLAVHVAYSTNGDFVRMITFNNPSTNGKQTGPTLKPDKGITWGSTPSKILKAYGTPERERGGPSYEIGIMQYKEIAFTFYKGRLISVRIPGKMIDVK